MNWFLVLLFWNPAIQDFAVADGWAPLQQPNKAICEERLLFAQDYLPMVVGDVKHRTACVMADNRWEAARKVKGDPV